MTEEPVADEGVVDLLTRHHSITGEWGVLISEGEDHIVSPLFLDSRQKCALPEVGSSIIHFQEPRLPGTPIFRHITHSSLEYRLIAGKIDEIVAANEERIRLTTPPLPPKY